MLKKYLVVRADGEARVVTRWPQRLRLDEFAYRLNITIPDTWSTVIGEISLALPEALPVVEVAEEIR